MPNAGCSFGARGAPRQFSQACQETNAPMLLKGAMLLRVSASPRENLQNRHAGTGFRSAGFRSGAVALCFTP
jgi:hypothetical protein